MKKEAYARRDDPDTSHAAAAQVDAETLMGQIVALLCASGPKTCREIAGDLGIDLQSTTPRMKPLEQRGSVMRIGTKKQNGRWATVWAWIPTDLTP